MNRSIGVSAVVLLAATVLFASPTRAACPYDVVGTTVLQPNVQLLPDGWVTYDGNRDWWEDDTLACYNAYLHPDYYEHLSGCDFDGDGVVEIAEVMEIYVHLGSAPGSVQCPVDNPAGEASVESVSFGGTGYNVITQDDSSGMFHAPHWQAGTFEGEPVAYVRGSSPAVSVTILAESAAMLSGAEVMIFGEGPDGLIIPATYANVAGDTASLSNAQMFGALPYTVYYYEPFAITWRLSIDGGGSWLEAGSTENTLYVLYDWPMSQLFETTVDIGCRNAKELSDPSDIVWAIWDDFADLNLYLKSNGHPMMYYRVGSDPGDMPTTPAEMLKEENGNCVGYANFFEAIALGQGVTGVQYTDIRPYRLLGNDTPYLLAKNWDWTAYWADPQNGWPEDNLTGIAGIGNPDPESKLFVNHVLVRYEGWILDTSYGFVFDTLLDWQRAIIDGVYYPTRVNPPGGPLLSWDFDVNPNDGTWPLLVQYY